MADLTTFTNPELRDAATQLGDAVPMTSNTHDSYTSDIQSALPAADVSPQLDHQPPITQKSVFASEIDAPDVNLTTMRGRLGHILRKSTFGYSLEIAQVSLSVLWCALYVYDTYVNSTATWFHAMELSIAAFFAWDYLLRFYVSENRIRFLFEWLSIVDVITVLPILAAPLFPFAIKLTFFSILRIAKILRIMRAYRTLYYIITPTRRQAFYLVFTVICLIFIAMGLMNIIEDMPLHTALYFLTVTFATVGYGDVTPKTTLGQMVIVCLIFTAAIMIPLQTHYLIELVESQQAYMGSFHTSRYSSHVVVTGSGQVTQAFLDELVNSRARRFFKVVLLHPHKPSAELKALIHRPKYESYLFYLRGSSMEGRDLERVKLRDARACFILSDKHAASAADSDKETVLRVLALKKYKPDLKVLVQLINPLHRRLLISAGVIAIVCTNEIKMSLLAHACLIPGLSTFMCDLIRSSKPKRRKATAAMPLWVREYEQGSMNDIHFAPIPSVFAGQPFADVVFELYCALEVVLFGCEIVEAVPPNGTVVSHIFLNPAGYMLRGGEMGFFIAPNDQFVAVLRRVEQTRSFEGLQLMPLRKLHMRDEENTVRGRLKKTWRHAVARQAGRHDEDQAMELLGAHADVNPTETWTEALRAKAPHLSPLHRNSAVWDAISFNQPPDDDNPMSLRDRRALLDLAATHGRDDAAEESAVEMARFDPLASMTEPENAAAPEPETTAAAAGAAERPMVEQPRRLSEAQQAHVGGLSQHILIIPGQLAESLYFLINNLRCPYLRQTVPVVVVHPEFTEEWWRPLSMYAHIYLVQGDPLSFPDLQRAGIERAKKVLILSKTAGGSDADAANSKHEPSLEDMEALLVYMNLELHMGSAVDTLIDVLHDESIRFTQVLTASKMASKRYANTYKHIHLFPAYAAGRVHTSSLLDSLICQAYFNPYILPIVKELTTYPRSKHDEFPFSHIPTARAKNIKRSKLYQVEVPKNMLDRRWSELFLEFVDGGEIPLGLFRRTNRPGKLPYVFTLPPQDTRIMPGDRLFILSTKNYT